MRAAVRTRVIIRRSLIVSAAPLRIGYRCGRPRSVRIEAEGVLPRSTTPRAAAYEPRRRPVSLHAFAWPQVYWHERRPLNRRDLHLAQANVAPEADLVECQLGPPVQFFFSRGCVLARSSGVSTSNDTSDAAAISATAPRSRASRRRRAPSSPARRVACSNRLRARRTGFPRRPSWTGATASKVGRALERVDQAVDEARSDVRHVAEQNDCAVGIGRRRGEAGPERGGDPRLEVRIERDGRRQIRRQRPRPRLWRGRPRQ